MENEYPEQAAENNEWTEAESTEVESTETESTEAGWPGAQSPETPVATQAVNPFQASAGWSPSQPWTPAGVADQGSVPGPYAQVGPPNSQYGPPNSHYGPPQGPVGPSQPQDRHPWGQLGAGQPWAGQEPQYPRPDVPFAGAASLPPTGPVPPTGDIGTPPNRTGLKILTGAAAVVLLAGGVGLGLVLAHNENHQAAQSSTGTLGTALPKPATSSSNGGTLSVQQIAAKVMPSEIDITSQVSVDGEQGEAAGSGIILTATGEALTNNHVIADGTKITARVDGSGRTYQVRVLGTDPTQDVALIQLVGASGLTPAAIGNSSEVQLGDNVVAIGNAEDLAGSPTVTSGIISALNRSITAQDSATGLSENLTGILQTSAQINPGNSGGPLVNSKGQVIGMNTADDPGSSDQPATSIGFAIPIDEALTIATEIQQGKTSSKIIYNHGFVGVEVLSIADVTSANSQGFQEYPTPAASSGAYVVGTVPGEPAADAGIQTGSVITSANGTRVTSPSSLGTILDKTKVGQSVSVTWVDTSGSTHTASLTMVGGSLP